MNRPPLHSILIGLFLGLCLVACARKGDKEFEALLAWEARLEHPSDELIRGYRAFVANYPSHPKAIESLERANRLKAKLEAEEKALWDEANREWK